MGRRLVVLFALVACVVLVLLLQRGGVFRAPSRSGPPESPVERKDAPEPAEPPGEPVPTREPTFLPGHVYGPDGSPVGRAEVRVVHPKTYDLVRSDKDGAYRLPIDRSGRFLVEAALTTELAPARAWVEIPEDGDPAPLDFHLQRARGALFGEVTIEGVPLDDARAYLTATDSSGAESPIHDMALEGGYFNFYLDPPKDVPLRLDVKSPYGILVAPPRFTWTGKPMDLGRIELTPYPSARIRMRLPDGSYAKGALPVRKEELQQDIQYMALAALPHSGPHGLLLVPTQEDVTTRCVFIAVLKGDDLAPYMVEREVTLFFGRRQEIELVVPRGPIVVAGRLLDREGRGLRGRLRCGESEAATGEDDTFRLTVPHGGLHVVHLVGLDVPGIGSVELARDVPAQSMLLDADHPADLVYDTAGRILLLANAPCAFRIAYDLRNRTRDVWSAGAAEGTQASCLSPRLAAGSYPWACDDTRGRVRSGEVVVEEGALAVVDAR
ncbi:MAG TPA: carboxypeptidase-like regulatory domain-containing protein [Planctomycetota bacterium]|nr:carboxypeptidase-like regulatory domain-containing protein [Planctomycetota bacterium]